MRYQVSSKEHDGASSLLLKATYVNIPDTKKVFSLAAQYACVVNIVIINGIFSLVESMFLFQHRLLPGATRSPKTARPRKVPPTQQPRDPRRKNGRRSQSRRATIFQSWPPVDGKLSLHVHVGSTVERSILDKQSVS